MPTLNSNVKAARIREEDLATIEPYLKKEGISFSELIHRTAEKIRLGLFEPSNDLSRSVPKYIIADFEAILNLNDTNFEEFFKKLYEKVENFDIEVDDIMK